METELLSTQLHNPRSEKVSMGRLMTAFDSKSTTVVLSCWNSDPALSLSFVEGDDLFLQELVFAVALNRLVIFRKFSNDLIPLSFEQFLLTKERLKKPNNIMKSLQIIFSLLILCKSCSGSCGSYENPCTAVVGIPMSVNQLPDIDIPTQSSFFITFQLKAITRQVYISASILYGTIDIFVSRNREPTPSDSDFSTNGMNIQDYLELNTQSFSTNDKINVMIRADTQTKLRLLIADPDANTPYTRLNDGTPVRCNLNTGTSRTFAYKPVSLAPFTVAVTPLTTGDPNLEITGPSSSSSSTTNSPVRHWNSSNIGADYIRIYPEYSDLNSDFIITITTIETSIFTIIAMESSIQNPTVLLSGFPQDGIIEQETSERYFTFSVPPGHEDVIITTETTGYTYLFINSNNKGFYKYNESLSSTSTSTSPSLQADWMAMNKGFNSISIQSASSNFITNGGKYYITIHGKLPSHYSIRAFLLSTVVTLSEGTSIIDTVTKGSYHYYRFFDISPNKDVAFDVLPLTGDADLMISCYIKPTGDDNGIPSRSKGHYNYSSQHMNEDAILIPAENNKNTCKNGIFYIAVYGYSNSNSKFKLSAMHRDGILTLTDGDIHQDMIYANIGALYKFYIGLQKQSLIIKVKPTVGDCDLFVRMNNKIATIDEFDYLSANFGLNVDIVTIPEQEICSQCWISILVYSFKTSVYTIITQLEDSTLSLTDGLPISESAEGGNLQYYSYIPSDNGNLTIVLTVFSGNPNMYISNKIEKPSEFTNFTLINDEFSNGNLPISHIPVVKNIPIYIGVGGNNDTLFTIRVFNEISNKISLLSLLNGIPQNDYIDIFPFGWKYYVLTLPEGHESIDVRVTNLVGAIGDVDVYMTRCPYENPYQCVGYTHGGDSTSTSTSSSSPSFLPNETYYIMTSKGQMIDMLHINREDVEVTTYVIGLRSISFYAEYSMSVTIQHTMLTLIPGISVLDHVEPGEKDFYSFFYDSPDSILKIALTPYSGDSDMIVISPSNHTWTATAYGWDEIVLDPYADENVCVNCLYRIIVYGMYSSTYSIIAKYDDTITHLIDGYPVTDSATEYTFRYYVFRNVYKDSRDFKVVVEAIQGNFDILISLNGEDPNWLIYDYYTTNLFSNTQEISILHTDEQYKPCLTQICSIRIAIFGYPNSQYMLTLTSTMTPVLLQLDNSRSSTIEEKSFDLYKALVNRKSYTLRLSVTQNSGHVEVYATCGNDLIIPDKNNSFWKLNVDTKNMLEIPNVLAEQQNCGNGTTFYFSVYGKSAATYTIMASFIGESLPLLRDGIESSNIISYQHLNYYYIKLVNEFDYLKLSVTQNDGGVEMFVSASWDTRPVLNDAQQITSYLFSQGTSNFIHISHSKISEICSDSSSNANTNANSKCYLIVGVLGVSYGNSNYRILLSYEDSTIILSSGVSIRNQIGQGQYQYYKYSQTLRKRDVVLSVTPFSGDPDVFISMKPITHPTRSNFTWISASFGTETITLQGHDIEHHCAKKKVCNAMRCDLYIGVYGARNSSYSIVASMDEGFVAPIILIDNQIQNGKVDTDKYIYYKFTIGDNFISDSNDHYIPESIIFTLTPLDGSDQDMYITFGENSEPGSSNYEYRSTSFSGTADEIIINKDMEHYCYNCIVNIAIFGFEGGQYTLVAHSKGLIQLQVDVAIGGHVNKMQYRYYTYTNTDSIADISFSVTPITGDPDIFINSYKKSSPSSSSDSSSTSNDNKMNLPTKGASQWQSYRPGGDSILISYKETAFCYDCEYIIGIYGYKNASYTLLVTSSQASIILLSKGRPQAISALSNDMKYFRFVLNSDAEDTTVSITGTDTGKTDMYIAIQNNGNDSSTSTSTLNDYKLPNPLDSSTYSYTTYGRQDNTLFIKGPHNIGTYLIIAVKVISTSHFNIIASTSQSLLLLRSGIPQNHYVNHGNTEYFKFLIESNEDIQITLSAQSGDPDLIVSSIYQNPHCDVSEAYWWLVNCYNYTWSSRLYSTDQIIISRDYPCKAVLPSTKINSQCDPNKALGSEIYIGIFGFETSKFTLLATALGEQIQLLPGKPQLGATHKGYICSHRSEDSGACLDSASVATKVQIAYFSFQISSQDVKNMKSSNLFITINPHCHTNNTASSSTSSSLSGGCIPGCSCGPLELYVQSCVTNACTQKDMFPSPIATQYTYKLTIDEYGSTLFISSDPLSSTYSPNFCDPLKQTSGCSYYISVISPVTTSTSIATFSIQASTPDDMSLIPCDLSPSPDGIRQGILDSTIGLSKNNNLGRFFEVCAGGKGVDVTSESIIVTVEECAGAGDLKMYTCADDHRCKDLLPTPQSWAFYSDKNDICTKSSTSISNNKKSCISNSYQMPSVKLPRQDGNYYMLVNGTGEFLLHMQTVTADGTSLAPSLVRSGIEEQASVLDITQVMDTTHNRHLGAAVTVTWKATKVLMPGMSNPVLADEMRYTAYIIDVEHLNSQLQQQELQQQSSMSIMPRFTSRCGINYAIEHYSTAIKVVPIAIEDTSSETLSHTFHKLDAGKKVIFVLLATCDGQCLRQLSKTVVNVANSNTNTRCDGLIECSSQHSIYDLSNEILIQGDPNANNNNNNHNKHWKGMAGLIISISIGFMIVIFIAIGILARFYYYIRHDEDGGPVYEMTQMQGDNHHTDMHSDIQIIGDDPMSAATDNNNNNNSNSFEMLSDRKSRWNKINLLSGVGGVGSGTGVGKPSFEPLITVDFTHGNSIDGNDDEDAVL
eukprot:gene3044-5962_t